MDRIAAEEGVSILEALAFDRTDPAAVELATRVSTFRIHDPQLQVRAAQMQAAVDRHRERLALGEIGGRHLRYLLDVHAPPEPRGLVVVDLCDLTPPANQP